VRAPAAAVLRPPLRLWAGKALAVLAPSPRQRRWLLVALAVAVALGCAYMFWFRNSSFVKVEQVSIEGARGDDAGRMRVALTGAARDMTTLNLDRDKLQRAVAGFSSVRTLEVSSDFPHSLRIRVIEHRPVALAVGDAGRVPVAGDGSILSGVPTGGALPTVRLTEPARDGRLDDGAALRLVAVAGGAPPVLTHRLTDVGVKHGRGIVAHLRRGPELIFGDASRLHDKWLAAARVLADPSARGAAYIDLRLPERPAAGGLPAASQQPSQPPATATPQQQQQAAPTTPAPGQQPQAATPQGPAQAQPAQPAPTAPQPPATAGGGVPVNPQP
jgi:cell division protein FtsQ